MRGQLSDPLAIPSAALVLPNVSSYSGSPLPGALGLGLQARRIDDNRTVSGVLFPDFPTPAHGSLLITGTRGDGPCGVPVSTNRICEACHPTGRRPLLTWPKNECDHELFLNAYYAQRELRLVHNPPLWEVRTNATGTLKAVFKLDADQTTPVFISAYIPHRRLVFSVRDAAPGYPLLLGSVPWMDRQLVECTLCEFDFCAVAMLAQDIFPLRPTSDLGTVGFEPIPASGKVGRWRSYAAADATLPVRLTWFARSLYEYRFIFRVCGQDLHMFTLIRDGLCSFCLATTCVHQAMIAEHASIGALTASF